MGRPRKISEITEDNLGINPFSFNLKIDVTKKKRVVINKYGNEDIDEYSLESTPYTKIFEYANLKDKVNSLGIRAIELLFFIINNLKGQQDYIVINRNEYMKLKGISSINTFKKAVYELCKDDGYIYPHATLCNVYWINPRFMFKGSRLNKYPKNIVVKKPSKD